MNAFDFYAPTKMVFGNGSFERLGEETALWGTCVLLVKQDGPLKEMGVYKKAVEIMEKQGLSVWELDGIVSNPRLKRITDGISLCKKENIDVVVGVGGGSAIDAAKAIAVGAPYDGDVWDFFARESAIKVALPIIAVSTVAAAGAEVSCHSVVTNDKESDSSKWQKWAIHDPNAFPKVAIIDPELQTSMPARLTAAGMCDIISHVLEGYFDGVPYNPLSDRIGEGLVLTVLECDSVLKQPDDLNARGSLAWAASLAISGLQDCGRSNAGFPAHWIQHAVGAITDSSHGEGLAVIEPAWLVFRNSKNPEKFAQFAQRVFHIQRSATDKDYDIGLAGIEALKERYKSWGMPATLREIGVTKDMLPIIVDSVLQSPETYVFEREELIQVLESCY